ncbi:hypothetical protein MNBD_NITROSPIRAE01-1835 [hydrothermal vent metagenome]|uniref:Uncharacterized protein n=1 Tax=hydrothermal vent metagenome TaxID=652676 RepID=A0A3B1CPD0_9ZZZZ
MVSCGYSLEFKRIDKDAEDPITVVRRELRQLKASHRVSLFDLQKEQEKQIESLQADLLRVAQGNETLGKTLIQMKRDLSGATTRLGQNNADTDERFSEMEIQHRLIHGRIEEESNRRKESTARGNDFTLKALESFRTDLATQQDALLQFQKKQAASRQILEEKMSGVAEKNLGIVQTTDGHAKTLQGVSAQVSELIDKMLPAVNGLAARVDDLEWALEKFKTNVESQDVQKRLSGLTEALDVQRKSLEMLGNTLAAQVDKQGALLKKTVKDLKGLQSKKVTTP